MSYKIARELAQETLKQNRDPSVIASVRIYLHCLALCQRSIAKTSSGEENLVVTESQEDRRAHAEVRDKFQKWLGDMSRWSQLHETLTVSEQRILQFC